MKNALNVHLNVMWKGGDDGLKICFIEYYYVWEEKHQQTRFL